MNALLLLLACNGGSKAPPVSVNDSCVAASFGYDDPSDDAKAGLDRTNCYRAIMGLASAQLEPHLDVASQNHAEYMATNGVITHQEDDDLDDYSGEWVWDRAENAGYEWPNGTVMMETVSVGYGPEAAVDGWVNSVYHRLPFTSPELVETGFGQEDRYSSMTFVAPFPYTKATSVLYPVDGQVDVPTAFNSDQEVPDPAPDATYVGPPITVSVGATSMPGTDQNPFNLQLSEASLEGPDGEVGLITLLPDDDPNLLYGLALIPEEPLSPDSEYTLKIAYTWAGGDEDLETTFTTGAE